MPSFEVIADQPVINLTDKEAFARELGALQIDPTEIDNLYGKTQDFNHLLSEDVLTRNKFPVLTQEREFVIGQGGTFSDKELKVALAIGHIVCDPAPNPEHGARINGSSIDVTMGRYFYTAGKHNGSGIFNPFSQKDTLRYFDAPDPETDYKEAKPWADVKRKLGKRALSKMDDIDFLENIPEDHPIVLLRPHERILAHTGEFIGIKAPGTTSMQARSTTGRIGLSACYCAGWGDPGYVNRWTMEIHNLNENEHLPIPVGFRIAQLVFSSTGPVDIEYAKATGNYQSTTADDLAQIERNWRPSSMLPKAYKNEVKLQIPVQGLQGGLQ